jgi:hypothetical protein
MPGEVERVESRTVCGARSWPKFGSFQISQKLTRGSGEQAAHGL